jgi:hypothetical protein
MALAFSPVQRHPPRPAVCLSARSPLRVQLVDRQKNDERQKRIFEWSFLTYGRVSNLSHSEILLL